MEAHGEDLRVESGDAKLAQQVKRDYRRARLTPRQKTLANFAVKATRKPSSVRPGDLAALRKHGLSDRDILDAVQVIAYFNYINRIADALGVDQEPEMLPALNRRK
ncbi:MAG: peroxidase-related enzyme [Acidobacteria bacterium]|nr:peroxidase-related enzyme [Acidobacteriota bacterium]